MQNRCLFSLLFSFNLGLLFPMSLHSAENLALGKGSLPEATDGNMATEIESPFANPLQVDLGALYNVNRIVIKQPNIAAEWDVVYSLDGKTEWHLLTWPGYHDPYGANDIDVNPTICRYLRLRIAQVRGGSWPYGKVAEFEVYGEAATTTSVIPVPRKDWMMTSYLSNVPVKMYEESGLRICGWDSRSNFSYGDWLAIDMGATMTFNSIITGNWKIGEGAPPCDLFVSDNGTDWGEKIAHDEKGGFQIFTFPTQKKRYFKLVSVHPNNTWVQNHSWFRIDDIAAYFEPEGKWPPHHDVPRVPPPAGTDLPGRVEAEWFVTSDAGIFSDILGSPIYSRSAMLQNISSATYKINVKEAGEYSVLSSYASKDDNTIEIRSENGTLMTGFPLPNTGSTQNFRIAKSNKFQLPAGSQTITVKYNGKFYPDYLDFVDKTENPVTKLNSKINSKVFPYRSNISIYSLTGARHKKLGTKNRAGQMSLIPTSSEDSK